MGRASSHSHSLVSVIVWNVAGCVFGPEVSHFDVFPLHWSLMFLLKVRHALRGCTLSCKAVQTYKLHEYDAVKPNSVLIYEMCSLMCTMCLYGEKLSMWLWLRQIVIINDQQP